MNYGKVNLFVCSSKNEVFSDTKINDVAIYATSNEQSIHIGALNASNKIKISPSATYVTGDLIAQKFALVNNKALLDSDGVINAISFIGDGSKLESLNASKITSGSISLPYENVNFSNVTTSNLKIGNTTFNMAGLSGLNQLSGSNATFSNVTITSHLTVDNVTFDSSGITGFAKLKGSYASLSNVIIESNLRIGNNILDSNSLQGFTELTGSNSSLSNVKIMSNFKIGNVIIDSNSLEGLSQLACSNAAISNLTIESNLNIGEINIDANAFTGFTKMIGNNGILSNISISSNLSVGNITLNTNELAGFTQFTGSNTFLSNVTITSNIQAGSINFHTNGLSGLAQLTGSNATLSNLLLTGDIDIRGVLTSYGQPFSLGGASTGTSELTLSAYKGATDGSLGTSSEPLSGGQININLNVFTNAIIEFSKVNTEATINFTPNPFSIDQVGQEGNIYLIERASTTRTVNLDSRMTTINKISNLVTKVNTTTANTSNIAVDVIKYRILRPDYAIYTFTNLHKPPLRIPPQLIPPGTTTLTNVTLGSSNIDLTPFFANQSGGNISYQVDTNIKDNAQILGSNIVITGNYRGATYNVSAIAKNFVGSSIPLIIKVTEKPGYPQVSRDATPIIDMTTNTITVNLETLFANVPGGGAMTYRIMYNPKMNATILDNIISVTGNWRGELYNIEVQAQNYFGASPTNCIVSVTEKIGKPQFLANGSITNLIINSKTLNLSTLFTNLSSATITYRIVNPKSNISIAGSILSATARNIDDNYNIEIEATNTYGTSVKNAIVNIIEIKGSPVAINKQLTLGENSEEVIFASLFNNSSGSTMAYSVTSNPKSNISVFASYITITGLYRNTTYTITISGTNEYGTALTEIVVTELNGAPIASGDLFIGSASDPLYVDKVKTVDLAPFIINISGAPLTYSVSKTYNNPYSISGSILSVTGVNRALEWPLYVSVSNKWGPSPSKITVLVTEKLTPIYSNTIWRTSTEGENVLIQFDLKTSMYPASVQWTMDQNFTWTVKNNGWLTWIALDNNGILTVRWGKRGHLTGRVNFWNGAVNTGTWYYLDVNLNCVADPF